MHGGLDTTFRLLADTPNEAAIDILVPALDSVHRAVREEALRALLGRRELAGHWALLRRWHELSQRWKRLVAERSERLDAAIRACLKSEDDQLFVNGCDAAVWTDQFDLVPVLVPEVQSRKRERGHAAAVALLGLAERIYESLVSPRDYSKRRDPQMLRHHFVTSVEPAVQAYPQHRYCEVLEAFLMMSNRENPTLKKILQDPNDKNHLAMVGMMQESERPAIMRLTLNYLDDAHAPFAVLRIISERADRPFLHHLLQKAAVELSPPARNNLKQMHSIHWLRDNIDIVCELSEEEQQGAIQLAMACNLEPEQALELVQFVLRHGKIGGRRAAAAVLPQFEGPLVNELALLGLNDNDPVVQTTMLGMHRRRPIANITGRLIELLDSSHLQVRKAVRQCLSEFEFRRFLGSYSAMNEVTRYYVGRMVRRVDPEALNSLRAELKSASRGRRLRGLELAPLLGAVGDMEAEIIALLDDDDHFVRAAAARALGHHNSWNVQQALNDALTDHTSAVRDAAEESLQ